MHEILEWMDKAISRGWKETFSPDMLVNGEQLAVLTRNNVLSIWYTPVNRPGALNLHRFSAELGNLDELAAWEW